MDHPDLTSQDLAGWLVLGYKDVLTDEMVSGDRHLLELRAFLMGDQAMYKEFRCVRDGGAHIERSELVSRFASVIEDDSAGRYLGTNGAKHLAEILVATLTQSEGRGF